MKVSVCMITYNHETHIAQSIEGVMMQQTTFPIELIIGEDCSTDNTRNICLEYQEKYPDKIRLILAETNLGAQQNFIITLQSCSGKYIALCDGDDYWTDPYKLQKQVDFLETNPDFTICFHPVSILINSNGILFNNSIADDIKDVLDIYDLSKYNFINTPSVVFRKNVDVIIQLASNHFFALDYVLHMLNAKYGKIKKMQDIMAVYRLHEGGIWSGKSQEYLNKQWVDQLEMMFPLFNEDVVSILKKQCGISSIAAFNDMIAINDYEKAKNYFIKACNYNPNSLFDNTIEIYNETLRLRKTKAFRLGKIVLKPYLFVKKLLREA